MRKQSWEACLEAQAAGKIRSIGVSNYGVKHIEKILAGGRSLRPRTRLGFAFNDLTIYKSTSVRNSKAKLYPFNASADIVRNA